MLSLISQVEADLRAISVDARKKFPEVKEAAERALLRLRTAQESLPKDALPAEQAAAVATAEEVLLPFLMALATRSDTLPGLALTGVQRMISYNALAPQRLQVRGGGVLYTDLTLSTVVEEECGVTSNSRSMD